MAAGCGGERSEPAELAEIPPALEAAGLELCETLEADAAGANALDRRAFVVGRSCDEGDLAVVEVVAWPDEAARDRALRQFEVQTRPSSRFHGVTWELGLLTVHVEGERDDAVVERVADAMDRLGAS